MKSRGLGHPLRTAVSAAGMTVAALAGMFVFLWMLAPPAHAVLSGENGRIVLISGRAPETDATARPYLLPVPSNSVGGGTLSPPISPPGGQYRHPSWSPDRTKIVYANGTAGVFDLFVQDLEAGTGPVQITPTESPTNLSADRPAWSPDGQTIVYEHQPAPASADRQIRSQSALDLQLPVATTDLTTAGGAFEGKPAWTPDSATVYFHRGDPNTAGNSDIYRKPAAGGTETLAIPDSGISEAQPSISPDGTRICYTLTNAGFNSTADVVVAPLANPASALIVSKSLVAGDYNCTWSPDGQMIAYVNGIFGTGRLVMVRADNTSQIEIELTQAVGAFDGNPDWAPDGRPLCPDTTVTTRPGTPVTFAVECTDTGPVYEQSEVREFADTQPNQGTLEQEFAGDPFTYSPNPGFTGTDGFDVTSFDELGFGSDRGTVTIEVRKPARCDGRAATIIGTSAKNRLTGTSGRDVIAGLGRKDVIKGRGGNDIICGGGGKDKTVGGGGSDLLIGGRGNDRQFGNRGRDRLRGSKGRDLCNGGPGRDRAVGCERLKSIP